MRCCLPGMGLCLILAGCGRDAVVAESASPPAAVVGTAANTVATTPAPVAPGNSVSARAGDPTVCVAGWLTQKGSEPLTFWAITDSAGVVWEVVNPEALAAVRNDRAFIEAPVAAIGRRVPRLPFVGLHLLDLRHGPCPEGVAG
jgi:hypothetical protein